MAGDGAFVSDLARTYDTDVRILGGAVETVAGERVGRIRIALPGPPEANEAPLRHLRETGHAVEVPA